MGTLAGVSVKPMDTNETYTPHVSSPHWDVFNLCPNPKSYLPLLEVVRQEKILLKLCLETKFVSYKKQYRE